MLGFSEEDVRQMVRYYQGAGVTKADEDTIVADMKPWYDNYCFAEESIGRDPKMFNTDMVCYYLHYYAKHGQPPKERIDPNTKTDYKKLKNLIRLESLNGRQLDIIHRIAGQGYVIGHINSSFPANRLTDPDNFISLLYYYGMLTITGTFGARLKLGIPNNNVRLQYYEYLREEYSRQGRIDVSALQDTFDSAAFGGDWRPMVGILTRAYGDNASVRSLIEGERNLQGFMSAFLSLNPYYLVAPEVEVAHGYCDFFLLPDHARYPEIAHAYILELKNLKVEATDSEAHRQWEDAVTQIHGYAKDRSVGRLLDGTRLHLLVVQVKGYKTLRAEEV